MNCINKVLLVISISLSFFESKLFPMRSSEINANHQFTCNECKLYNSLLKVALTNLKLQRSNSFENLREAQEPAQHYDLHPNHHTDINDNEIMIEKHETFEGQDALVTRPFENEVTPASWIFDGEHYLVFEYSDNPYVSK